MKTPSRSPLVAASPPAIAEELRAADEKDTPAAIPPVERKP